MERELDKAQVERLVDTGNCPICSHDSISYGDKEWTDDGASQDARCDTCGAEWTEYYTLSAVTITSDPTEDDSDDPTSIDYEEEEAVVPCPICGGIGIFLGALANLAHFRCRNCGGMFSHEL